MVSQVVYSHDFAREVDQGTLAPEQFKYHFLCEGDSWMDRSSPTQLSLPWALAETFDTPANSALFVNLSLFGDTLRRIGDCLNGDFLQWMRTPFSWNFDAILFSAGGNDFIDAALDPPAGAGILRLVMQDHPMLTEKDCFEPGALAQLVSQYLDPNFDKLYDTIRGSRQGNVPILLNSYDLATARNAPAVHGSRAWLYEAYRKNGIPHRLWRDVTERLFIEIEHTVKGWAQRGVNVVQVPTSGTLHAADAASTGESGDWLNEIHPNRTGWRKLARVWRDELDLLI